MQLIATAIIFISISSRSALQHYGVIVFCDYYNIVQKLSECDILYFACCSHRYTRTHSLSFLLTYYSVSPACIGSKMGDWIDIHSQNNLQYVFIPVTSGAVKLKVKAACNAYIALTKGPFEENPMTEIHICESDGWNHTKSIIRRDKTEPDMAVVAPMDNILSQTAFVELWISWHNNKILAGVKGEPAFIEYLDPRPHPINYIGVRTGSGVIGHWKIEVSPLILSTIPVKSLEGGQLKWVKKTQNQPMPLDAFIGGYENGEIVYIARALYRASLIPGKYVPSKQCAFIGYGLQTSEINTCQILCGRNASWVKTKGDQIPPHVFSAGYATETNREPLFIGRARINGHLIPGKLHTHYKTCYIPYENRELELSEYEILVIPDKLPDAVIWRQRHDSERRRDDNPHSEWMDD